MIQGVAGTVLFMVMRHAVTSTALIVLLGVTSVALGISSMHLGRPAYAWRALRMWRRSWLSREVLLFTLFFGSLTAMTGTAVYEQHIGPIRDLAITLGLSTAVLGILATIASACIYLVPARPSWNTSHTPIDFLLTAALLGSLAAGAFGKPMFIVSVISATAWIANYGVRVFRLQASGDFESNASYGLLASDQLLPYSCALFACIVAGFIACAAGHPLLALLVTWAGTLLARYLFFVSVVPLKMALTFLQGSPA
jgi:DMSO reductase anchor subunit